VQAAGKVYGQPFGVDVAFGGPILGDPEIVVAADVLAFAGIAPPTLRIYPIETHLPEKLPSMHLGHPSWAHSSCLARRGKAVSRRGIWKHCA
jgi:hypothetical protein